MKHTGQGPAPGENVPRDSDTADAAASDRRYVPGVDDRNAPDEDQATTDRPLAPDSPQINQLHKNPPRAGGQLDVGTGGDAGRPGKEGTTGKPIPPRGRVV